MGGKGEGGGGREGERRGTFPRFDFVVGVEGWIVGILLALVEEGQRFQFRLRVLKRNKKWRLKKKKKKKKKKGSKERKRKNLPKIGSFSQLDQGTYLSSLSSFWEGEQI